MPWEKQNNLCKCTCKRACKRACKCTVARRCGGAAPQRRRARAAWSVDCDARGKLIYSNIAVKTTQLPPSEGPHAKSHEAGNLGRLSHEHPRQAERDERGVRAE